MLKQVAPTRCPHRLTTIFQPLILRLDLVVVILESSCVPLFNFPFVEQHTKCIFGHSSVCCESVSDLSFEC